MRILQLHNRHRAAGGADVVIEREARALTERGHVVDALFVEADEVDRIGSLRAGLKSIHNGSFLAELDERCDTFRPDLVHVHTPFPLMSPAVFRRLRSRGLPTVATVHSFRYSCVSATLHRDGHICQDCVGRRIKMPAIRHSCYHDSRLGSAAMATALSVHHNIGTFTHVNRFLVMTQRTARLLEAERISPRNITVKPNFAPDPGPATTTRQRQAAFVGRLTREKGIDTLLAAWKQVQSNTNLVIAGDGPLRADVERAAAGDERIRVLGWVEPREVATLLANSRLLVLPSEWFEAGLPLVGIEAFAAGTPVLASDIENIAEAITDGVDGSLFATGDPASLAEAVDRLTDEGVASAMHTGARSTYERTFGEAVVMDQLEAVYRSVCGLAVAAAGPSR